MERDARADSLKLLSHAYQNASIRILLDEKAFTVRVGNGKPERFPYKKVRLTNDKGNTVFQSDGLKLTLSKISENIQQTLATAVKNGTFEAPSQAAAASAPTGKTTVRPTAVSKTAQTTTQSRISKDALVYPPKTSGAPHLPASSSTVHRPMSTLASTSRLTQQPVHREKGTPVQVKTASSAKPAPSSGSTVKSTPESKPSSHKTTSPGLGRVALTLESRLSPSDFYDHTESSPLSVERPIASPDTLFPTTDTAHVASPIPKMMLKKYGTKASLLPKPASGSMFPARMRLPQDSTPVGKLYSGTPVKKGGSSAVSSLDITLSPQVPPRAQHDRTQPPSQLRNRPEAPKPVTKHAVMMTALERLTAENNNTNTPFSRPAPHTGVASNDKAVHASAEARHTPSRRPSTPPASTWSNVPPAAVARLSGVDTVDLTAATASAPARTSTAPQLSTLYRNFFDPLRLDRSDETARLPVRPRLPGGVRNLGNTCYISATIQVMSPDVSTASSSLCNIVAFVLIQALCAQKLLRDTFGASFWPSLIAQQNAAQLLNVPAASAAGAVVHKTSDSDLASLADNSLCPGTVSAATSVGTGLSTAVSDAVEGNAVAMDVDGDAAVVPQLPSVNTDVGSAAVAAQHSYAALEKYRVHSVLHELCSLVR
jgi:hypothetical protein